MDLPKDRAKDTVLILSLLDVEQKVTLESSDKSIPLDQQVKRKGRTKSSGYSAHKQ